MAAAADTDLPADVVGRVDSAGTGSLAAAGTDLPAVAAGTGFVEAVAELQTGYAAVAAD